MPMGYVLKDTAIKLLAVNGPDLAGPFLFVLLRRFPGAAPLYAMDATGVQGKHPGR